MSEIKTDKISPATGTSVTIGSNVDSVTIPSNVTIKFEEGGKLDISSYPIRSLNKNLIINGNMVINQRHRSGYREPVHYTSGSPSWPVDMFVVQQSNMDQITWNTHQNTNSTAYPLTDRSSQGNSINDSPTLEDRYAGFLSEFPNFIRVKITTPESTIASDEKFYIATSVEANRIDNLGWGTVNAKPLTLSFWVKSSETGSFGVVVKHHSNVDVDAGSDEMISYIYNIEKANTWEKKTWTIPGETTEPVNSSSTNTSFYAGLWIEWLIATGKTTSADKSSWGTNDDLTNPLTNNVATTQDATFDLTGVQLEVGEIATSFDHEEYYETKRKCMRYYYGAFQGPNTGYNDMIPKPFQAFYNTATDLLSTISLPVDMARPPTFNTSGVSDFIVEPHGDTPTIIFTTYIGNAVNDFTISWTVPSQTQGHKAEVQLVRTDKNYYEFDATLS